MSNILRATNQQIANTIRSNMSLDYQERIPELTASNVEDVFNAIVSYQPDFNAFNSALVNKIGLSYFTRKDKFENPLASLKEGMMPYGTRVEEIYVGLVKAKTFDPENSAENVFKRNLGDTRTLYHEMNRQDKYPITISEEELKGAFYSEYGLNQLITRKYDALFESDSLDEFTLMKQLIASLYTHGGFYPVIVDAVTDEASAKKLVTQMRAISTRLTFIKDQYNPMKVPTRTLRNNQVVLISPETEAFLDVNVLAMAFHMDKAELMGRIIVVDDFSGDSDSDMSHVEAMIVDRDVWKVWDTLFRVADIYNPDGLYWNAFLHHWQIMSYSLFCNAVVFSTAITATAIAITAPQTTVNKGGKVKLSATVTGDPSNTVIWSVTAPTDPDTYIDGVGVLHVGKNETVSSLTVKATSAYTSTVTKTQAITVQGN